MNDTNHDANKDPEQLEREVQHARERLSHTVDAISDRLSPGELLDQALNVSKDYGGEFARNFGQQAKDNPLALMMTGVGMAWMMLGNQQRHDSYYTGRGGQRSFGQSGSSRLSDLKDKIADKFGGSDSSDSLVTTSADTYHYDTDYDTDSDDEGLKEKLRQRMADMPDREQVGEQMDEYVQSAKSHLHRTMQEQPLMAGALGVALGAALGALLPPSDVEDRLMGEHSDKMTDKATRMAADEYRNVKETVRQKASEASERLSNNDQLADSGDRTDSDYRTTGSNT